MTEPTMEEWLARCQQARAAGHPIPDAQLMRRMLTHEFCLIGTDAFASEALLPPGEQAEPISGLQLAGTVNPTCELRIHFATDAPPLTLAIDEVQHLQSFVPVTVVEALLSRLQQGEDLQLDEPFARLREFKSFLTVCAGGHGQPSADGEAPAGSPLMLALAPDEGGRRLAAAFTAQDALQLFIVSRESARGSDDLVSVRLTGRELFEQIASGSELDGVVFNPSGPGLPVALSREVADLVLSGK